MPTYLGYTRDCQVRFRLELVAEGNSLRVAGLLTDEGEQFLFENAMWLLDSDSAEIVLDMREARPAARSFVATIARVDEGARARNKSLAVLASGEALGWLRDAGLARTSEAARPAHA